MCVLLFRFFAIIGCYKTVSASVLCSRPLLPICRVCRSVWLFIPNSQFIPPSPFPHGGRVCCRCLTFPQPFLERKQAAVCPHRGRCACAGPRLLTQSLRLGREPPGRWAPAGPTGPPRERRLARVSAIPHFGAPEEDRRGNGNPLQAAGLENPTDRRGACRATGRGAAQSRTRLSAWAQRSALESPRLLKARPLGSPPRFLRKSGVSLRTCIFNTFPGCCWWSRVMLWKLPLSHSGPPPHTRAHRAECSCDGRVLEVRHSF